MPNHPITFTIEDALAAENGDILDDEILRFTKRCKPYEIIHADAGALSVILKALERNRELANHYRSQIESQRKKL